MPSGNTNKIALKVINYGLVKMIPFLAGQIKIQILKSVFNN